MKLTGSLAVLAVAAALSGNAAAGGADCLQDIGFTAADGITHEVNPANTSNPQNVDGQFGVWRAISEQQKAAAFLGSKFSSTCLVPKSVKGKGAVAQVQVFTADDGKILTVDQCSFYQALGSADAKLWVGKTLEAIDDLATLKAKARALSDASVTRKPKLTVDGANAIGAAIDAALICIGS